MLNHLGRQSVRNYLTVAAVLCYAAVFDLSYLLYSNITSYFIWTATRTHRRSRESTGQDATFWNCWLPGNRALTLQRVDWAKLCRTTGPITTPQIKVNLEKLKSPSSPLFSVWSEAEGFYRAIKITHRTFSNIHSDPSGVATFKACQNWYRDIDATMWKRIKFNWLWLIFKTGSRQAGDRFCCCWEH